MDLIFPADEGLVGSHARNQDLFKPRSLENFHSENAL
jgi:hypothetical protein